MDEADKASVLLEMGSKQVNKLGAGGNSAMEGMHGVGGGPRAYFWQVGVIALVLYTRNTPACDPQRPPFPELPFLA